MKIVDFLRSDLILSDLRASKKLDVIRELASHLARIDQIDEPALIRVLLDRERLGSTGLGEGIAVPHGKLASVGRLTGCLGRSRKGLDFESEDGKATHFIFILVAPQEAAGEHLKALARISRLFRDAGFRKRLQTAKTAQEMFAIIEQEDGAVQSG